MAGAFSVHGSDEQILGLESKSQDVGKATKGCSALRNAERVGPNSNVDPLCQLALAVNSADAARDAVIAYHNWFHLPGAPTQK